MCPPSCAMNRFDVARVVRTLPRLSFYKIMGFPTGVGCLLMRRDRFDVLSRPWFAGGTITIASVVRDSHYLRRDEGAFEDGTVDYLNLPAVTIGLRHVDRVGLDSIHRRVGCLTGWLLDALDGLRHHNGRRLVQIHGPRTVRDRGGTVTLAFTSRRTWPMMSTVCCCLSMAGSPRSCPYQTHRLSAPSARARRTEPRRSHFPARPRWSVGVAVLRRYPSSDGARAARRSW